jgi:cell division protein FtsQ
MKKPTRVERKRRRNRIMFRLVLMLSLIVFGISYVFKSEFFNIEKVNVNGNNILSDDIIIKASSINIGENIFKISKSDVFDNIESLPYIKEVNMKRKLPDIINIDIIERKPIIQLKMLSSYIILDNEGFVLEVADKKIDKLPSFVGFAIEEQEPGKNISSTDTGVKIMEFFNEDELIPIIYQMNAVNLDTYEEINIVLNNGISVAFGPLDNVKYKLRLLDKILKDIDKKQLKCNMIIMNKGENPILVLDN